ncbi:hypothetical protein ACJX0J_013217, partial [Zea mays]
TRDLGLDFIVKTFHQSFWLQRRQEHNILVAGEDVTKIAFQIDYGHFEYKTHFNIKCVELLLRTSLITLGDPHHLNNSRLWTLWLGNYTRHLDEIELAIRI